VYKHDKPDGSHPVHYKVCIQSHQTTDSFSGCLMWLGFKLYHLHLHMDWMERLQIYKTCLVIDIFLLIKQGTNFIWVSMEARLN